MPASSPASVAPQAPREPAPAEASRKERALELGLEREAQGAAAAGGGEKGSIPKRFENQDRFDEENK